MTDPPPTGPARPSRLKLVVALALGAISLIALGSIFASTVDVILLLVGFVLLLGGAEYLVRGAATMARRLGVNSLIIGLTVVAFGTSAPELFIGVIAVIENKSDFNVGNVVGSNIANVGLILGATALTLPFAVSRQALRHDIPIMILVTLLAIWAFWDGTIQRYEGIIGLVLLAAYLAHSFKLARLGVVQPDAVDTVAPPSKALSLILPPSMIIGGLLALVGGAWLLIESGASIAREFGVSEIVIGLTIVALGTSLPELATCVVAAWRNQPEIVIGNVVGSNLFNLLFVLGVTSAIAPIAIPPVTVNVDVWVMLAFAVAMPVVALIKRRITRVEGAILVIGYLAYVVIRYTMQQA